MCNRPSGVYVTDIMFMCDSGVIVADGVLCVRAV
jgi:hypothetical protein